MIFISMIIFIIGFNISFDNNNYIYNIKIFNNYIIKTNPVIGK